MLIGLRYSVTRAHGYTPYRILFGIEPSLPSSLKIREFDVEAALAAESEEALAVYADELAVGM